MEWPGESQLSRPHAGKENGEDQARSVSRSRLTNISIRIIASVLGSRLDVPTGVRLRESFIGICS